MSVDDVRKRVADIAAAAGDPEVAHSLEDDLYRDFVTAIASGHWSSFRIEGVAFEVLKTKDISFARRCA